MRFPFVHAFAATLEFEYDDPSRAAVVAESVAREIGEIDDDRSRTSLERDGDDGSQVRLEIDAADPVALRAALNTWVTLVDVAERTATIGDRDTSAYPRLPVSEECSDACRN